MHKSAVLCKKARQRQTATRLEGGGRNTTKTALRGERARERERECAFSMSTVLQHCSSAVPGQTTTIRAIRRLCPSSPQYLPSCALRRATSSIYIQYRGPSYEYKGGPASSEQRPRLSVGKPAQRRFPASSGRKCTPSSTRRSFANHFKGPFTMHAEALLLAESRLAIVQDETFACRIAKDFLHDL